MQFWDFSLGFTERVKNDRWVTMIYKHQTLIVYLNFTKIINLFFKSDWLIKMLFRGQQRCWSKNMSHLVKSVSATLQCAWIKKILQRRVGQNISTAMWKTHCQLSQTLDCSWCCKGWHNQSLVMGQLLFHVGPGRFFPLTNQIISKLFYLCVI